MKKKTDWRETDQKYQEIDFVLKILKVDFKKIITNCQNLEISLLVATILWNQAKLMKFRALSILIWTLKEVSKFQSPVNRPNYSSKYRKTSTQPIFFATWENCFERKSKIRETRTQWPLKKYKSLPKLSWLKDSTSPSIKFSKTLSSLSNLFKRNL